MQVGLDVSGSKVSYRGICDVDSHRPVLVYIDAVVASDDTLLQRLRRLRLAGQTANAFDGFRRVVRDPSDREFHFAPEVEPCLGVSHGLDLAARTNRIVRVFVAARTCEKPLCRLAALVASD